MKFRNIFIVISGLVISESFYSRISLARDIVYGKTKESLPILYGMETLFRFPMEVKTITDVQKFEIQPSGGEEPDYSMMSVRPRGREGVSDVSFILADGSVIRTQLVISTQSHLKKDLIYDFKPKDELTPSNPNLSDHREPLAISELDLMRAMVSGERISSFEIQPVDQPIDMNFTGLSQEVAKQVSVRLIKRYVGSQINGFIYLIETRSPDLQLSVHLEKLGIGRPNLALLAQVDHPNIGGETQEKRQTLLRVIAKPGASSRKLALPLAIQKEEKS